MAYDSSWQALLHSERSPPNDMTGWTPEQQCAELARLAYVRFEDGPDQRRMIEHSLASIGYGDVRYFNDDRARDPGKRLDAQAFGAKDRQGNGIIAFRGSQPDSFRDVLIDLTFVLEAWEGAGEVHCGFRDSLRSILRDIDDWLPPATASLTITGHSLGAALATLLAALRPNAKLVTFGSPLVGDAVFAASMAGRDVRRYVDCTDLITEIPPPLIGYAHVGRASYIDRNGKLATSPLSAKAIREDRRKARLAYIARGILPWNVTLRELADHAPINYITGICGTR